MKKMFTAIVILLFVTVANTGATPIPVNRHSQTVIKGNIYEKNSGEPLGFATIALYDANGKVVSGTTADENGYFEIKNAPNGEYTIQISFIGYKTVDHKVTLNETQYDLSNVELEEDAQQLTSAVVTEKIPLLEQKIDKLIMNVSERVTTAGSDAIDIIKKAPGVSVDMDGNIKLNGSTVAIWIDGRPSQLSGQALESLLNATPADNIDKIEIISNPSSKYDAEGTGGIINIKTKKNFLQGFNGSLNGGAGGIWEDKYLFDSQFSANLNYRSEKTNSFINYGYKQKEYIFDFDSWLHIPESGMYQISESSVFERDKTHTLRVGNDWYLGKKDVVGAIINYSTDNSSMNTYIDRSNDTNLFADESDYDKGVISQTTTSNIKTPTGQNNVAANLNYTHKFDESKSEEITLNADYNYFDLFNHSIQDNTLKYMPGSSEEKIFQQYIVNNTDQFINMYSAKADYQRVVWNTGILEVGAKWAMTETDNTMVNDSEMRTKSEIESGETSFVYNEKISAAYFTLANSFSQKFSTKVGLRAEYTDTKGDWKSEGVKTDNSYIDFFPTAFVSYIPDPKIIFALSYSRRLSRPSFYQLNYSEQYADANTVIVGNPKLDPEYINQFYLNMTLYQYFNVMFIYNRTDNVISQSPFFNDETGFKTYKWDNFGIQSLAGGGISISEFPIIKDRLIMSFNTNVFYVKNTTNSEKVYAGEYENNGLMAQGKLSLSAFLPKNFKIEFVGTYSSKVHYGYFIIDPIYQIDLGMRKDILNNKLSLSLNVKDLLGTGDTNLRLYDKGVCTYKLNQDLCQTKIMLSLTYRFGKAQQSAKRNVGNVDETSRVSK